MSFGCCVEDSDEKSRKGRHGCGCTLLGMDKSGTRRRVFLFSRSIITNSLLNSHSSIMKRSAENTVGSSPKRYKNTRHLTEDASAKESVIPLQSPNQQSKKKPRNKSKPHGSSNDVSTERYVSYLLECRMRRRGWKKNYELLLRVASLPLLNPADLSKDPSKPETINLATFPHMQPIRFPVLPQLRILLTLLRQNKPMLI